MYRGNAPIIKVMGPYATTHVRHFAQKAQYSVAAQWDRGVKQHYFCSHHAITDGDHKNQDVLFKLTIPRSDRIAALGQLEDYNINHYTLFQTEDSLVQWQAMRAFDLDE